MRAIRFLIFFSISNYGFSQSNALFKTWIDKDNEALIITDSVLYLDEGHGGLRKSDYRISKDTLYLIEYQWADTKQFPSETDYHIIKLTTDSMFLVYNKKYLGELTGQKDTLKYVDSVTVKSRITNFDKLLFQTTYLSSVDVRTKLEIDIAGDVYFWNEQKKSDYYHIKLDRNHLDSLTMLISRSRIENLSEGVLGVIIDNPGYFLTLNAKNETIRRTSNGPPYLNWALFEYLYKISENVARTENINKSHIFIK